MVPGVNEVLGVVHDFHGGAAVHSEPDAVLRGNGVLQDLLRAVRMDEDGHSAGFHIGDRDLHLGLARALGYFDVHHGRGIGIPGGFDLNRGLDRLAILLGGLDGLAAQLGLRRGLAVLVGLHRAGGAIGGLVLGDGAAVGIGCGLGDAAILAGGGLHLGAVLLGLGLGDGAVVILGGFGLDRAAAGGIPVRGRTAGG